MTANRQTHSESQSHTAAYLVVREGDNWRDIFRLTPGQVVSIGRAPTNRIVIRDEICSRHHCEIFQRETDWVLRDLGSRNGTLVDGTRVSGERTLEPGQLIQIGECQLGFTDDLSRSFPQTEPAEEAQEFAGDSETVTDGAFDHPHLGDGVEPAILHRTRKTRFHAPVEQEGVVRDRTSRELAKLYRLALEMGTTRDSLALSEIVLDGLFSGTCADLGAILLLPDSAKGDAAQRPDRLKVITNKSLGEHPYQKVSDYLARVVLENHEAILARDVADDSRLVDRDSLGQIYVQSVICAPIRVAEKNRGLIHLCSTDPEEALDPDDLEFTLAVADQLAVALENLKEKEVLEDGLARARNENETLRQQLELETDLVGDSSSMQKLRENMARIAPTDATVLIRGESGVGKELVARGIHFNSSRRDGPFVCLNCAALSESLLESELFGHEKGSFTGATDQKRGKFEQAHQGTLFLDEVGEMSQAIQAKFLRALEGHSFERVGGGSPIKVDVRVVAATNRDLEQAVEEGAFRKDLYFRLHVVELPIEPLRDHPSDIPLLANHFLQRFAWKIGRRVRGFTQGAAEAMTNYDWPGNVRELQNTVERSVILCTGELITEKDLQLSTFAGEKQQPAASATAATGYREISLGELEQEHILATLEWTDWNKSKASQILGIERSTLDRKLKRYQVTRPKS